MPYTLQHPRQINSVTAHTPATTRRSLYFVVLALFYAPTLYYAATTLGEPYEHALREATAFAANASAHGLNGSGGKWRLPGTGKDGKKLKAAQSNDAASVLKKAKKKARKAAKRAAREAAAAAVAAEGDFDEFDENPAKPVAAVAVEVGPDGALGDADDADDAGGLDAAFDKDEAALRADEPAKDASLSAAAAAGSVGKTVNLAGGFKLNLTTDEDGRDSFIDQDGDERPLPSAWLPNAWAGAALFMVVSMQLLFHLLCRWSVRFKVQRERERMRERMREREREREREKERSVPGTVTTIINYRLESPRPQVI